MNETEQSEPLPFQISICSFFAVDKFRARGVTHLLSIDDPGNPSPTPQWFKGTHWHLAFHDVESDMEARELSATAPSREDAQQILNHGASCLEASRSGKIHLLVHCVAGVSRSTAAAFAIICSLLGPGQESTAFTLLMIIRPEAFPNKFVVQHADDILGRHGTMIKALVPLRDEAAREAEAWIKMMELQRLDGVD